MAAEIESNCATFFLSTGRCGTQWFAHNLARCYREFAEVRHEPFQEAYLPRTYFTKYHRGDKENLTPALEKHITDIGKTLEHKSYVETGWFVYGVLPYFIARLEGKIKIIHLQRSLFTAAASVASQNHYLRSTWTNKVALFPKDSGVVQQIENWERLSEYEKCLFFCTEVSAYAMRLKDLFPAVPWLTIKYETIFNPRYSALCLGAVLRFLRLPVKNDFLIAATEKIDSFGGAKPVQPDKEYLRLTYPTAFEVSKLLGY